MPETEWYFDHRNLAALCRWLAEEQDYDAENILDVIEKPWKFTDEWNEYQQWLSDREFHTFLDGEAEHEAQMASLGTVLQFRPR